MAQWTGDVNEEQQLGPIDKAIRRCVMTLVDKGGCNAEVAQSAVRELLANLAELGKPSAQQAAHNKLMAARDDLAFKSAESSMGRPL